VVPAAGIGIRFAEQAWKGVFLKALDWVLDLQACDHREGGSQMWRTVGLIVILLVVLASSAYAGETQISGLIQTQYVDEGNQDSQYLIKAARLKVLAPITGRINGKLQVDFAREPLILDAALDFSVISYANFTVGQFSIPFGYEFQLSRFYLEAIDRSLIMKRAFGNGISSPYVRDVGAMVHGRFKILNYALGAFNGTGYDYHGGDDQSPPVFAKWNVDNNNTKDIVGRIGVGVPMLAGLGFSFYEGSWACDQDRSALGFYFHIDTGKVLFQYEYLKGEGYLGGEEWMDYEYGGYYIVAGYRITQFIQPTFKIDKLDPNKDEGDDNLTDLRYGLNLNFERSARLQVFYRESERGGDFIAKGWCAQVGALF
jgi:hypothetical protein